MDMAAAGDVGPSRLRQRLSSHNLKLNIDEANRIAQLDADKNFEFAPSECRIVNDGSDCQCSDDIKIEGKELFTNFVKEEICRSGLEEQAKTVSPWIVE